MSSDSSVIPAHSFSPGDFLHNTSVVMYQCSLEENFPITFISPNVKKVLGFEPQEFYKNSTAWVKKIHPEDRPGVSEAFLDIIDETQRTFVYRFKRADDTFIWLRDENMVTYDDDGKPTAITGTAIDITDQKQAEQEVKKLNETLEQRIKERTENLTVANRKLKKQIQYRNKVEQKISEQQHQLKLLQAGINHIQDMVIISKAPVEDPMDSKIIYVNKAFERFTGYNRAEVMGSSPAILHGSKTRSKNLKNINDCVRNNEHVRVEVINYKKDGTPYWVDLEMSPFPAEEDGMEYWVGVNRNISKRKAAELALEESEQKYRAYSELSFDAIFEITEDGTIADCNARAQQLFGYTREELLGMNVQNFIPDKYEGTMPNEMSPKITTDSEVLQRVYKKKDGSLFPCEINTKYYQRDGKGHVIAYVRDVSEQVAYEEKIEQSLKEKSTLLAEVHHRVKNNLAVISGLLEMQTFNTEDKQVARKLKESQSRIQSIATVHEKLYQSESFSDITLDSYIQDLVSYISNTFGNENTNVHFEKDIDPISLTVSQAIPCGLLLNELITNTYKHAFPEQNEGTIAISMHQKRNTAHLTVEDDGVGLPPDFDIEQSSSLGMTLISTLVQQLGGSLSIQSAPSTRFQISFDIVENQE